MTGAISYTEPHEALTLTSHTAGDKGRSYAKIAEHEAVKENKKAAPPYKFVRRCKKQRLGVRQSSARSTKSRFFVRTALTSTFATRTLINGVRYHDSPSIER